MPSKNSTYSNTLLRGLSILKCFNESNDALSVSELARRTGIPQPTVWRFCQSLQSEGYLILEPNQTKFRPGLALLSLGFSAISHLGLAELARQYLIELSTRFRVVAGIAIPDGLNMRIVDRHQTPGAVLSYNVHVGSTVPMIATASGWAYLAGLDAASREQMLTEAAQEQPDVWKRVKGPIRKALREYSDTGIIINSGMYHDGLTAVAAPIRRVGASRVYAIYCSGISTIFTKEVLKQLTPRLKTIAGELSAVVTLT